MLICFAYLFIFFKVNLLQLGLKLIATKKKKKKNHRILQGSSDVRLINNGYINTMQEMSCVHVFKKKKRLGRKWKMWCVGILMFTWNTMNIKVWCYKLNYLSIPFIPTEDVLEKCFRRAMEISFHIIGLTFLLVLRRRTAY